MILQDVVSVYQEVKMLQSIQTRDIKNKMKPLQYEVTSAEFQKLVRVIT